LRRQVLCVFSSICLVGILLILKFSYQDIVTLRLLLSALVSDTLPGSHKCWRKNPVVTLLYSKVSWLQMVSAMWQTLGSLWMLAGGKWVLTHFVVCALCLWHDNDACGNGFGFKQSGNAAQINFVFQFKCVCRAVRFLAHCAFHPPTFSGSVFILFPLLF
jgi:hypothetical protein